MTKERLFKRRVRGRIAKTGESYTAARRQVSQKRDHVQAARARLGATADRRAVHAPSGAFETLPPCRFDVPPIRRALAG